MKYPKEQMEVFKQFLEALRSHLDPSGLNGHSVHFMCYQQHSEGHEHNWLHVTKEGELKRAHRLTLEEKGVATKLFTSDFEFKLYPEGCNDSHISTMLKHTMP